MSFGPGFPTRNFDPWQHLVEFFSLALPFLPQAVFQLGIRYAPRIFNTIQIISIDRKYRDPDFSPRQAVDNLLFNLQRRIQGDRSTPISKEQICDDMGCYGSGQTMAILKVSKLMGYTKVVMKDGSLYCFLTEKGVEQARIVEARWKMPPASLDT